MGRSFFCSYAAERALTGHASVLRMPCGRKVRVFYLPGAFDPGLLMANRAAVQHLPDGQPITWKGFVGWH